MLHSDLVEFGKDRGSSVPDAKVQHRLKEMAYVLNDMVAFLDQQDDFVLAAKLEDARVTMIRHCEKVAE